MRPDRPAPAQHPGWAGSGGSSLAGISFPGHHVSSRLGRFNIFRLGQAEIPLAQAGLLLGRLNFPSPGQLSPFGAEIYLLRHILLIRHRLQRLVPILGRLQAQTGTSSIVICWSWDAPLAQTSILLLS
jgi:hypothetical protein